MSGNNLEGPAAALAERVYLDPAGRPFPVPRGYRLKSSADRADFLASQFMYVAAKLIIKSLLNRRGHMMGARALAYYGNLEVA